MQIIKIFICNKIYIKIKKKVNFTHKIWSYTFLVAIMFQIKGTKWAVFGGKSIHYTWYWKWSIVSAWIRTPDPWITKLNYLTCWWMGNKSSVYQVHDTKSLRYTQLSQNDAIANNLEQKCCVQTAATLTLASTHVFLIKMCQECYNRRESRVF